jgi:hypothetical protein
VRKCAVYLSVIQSSVSKMVRILHTRWNFCTPSTSSSRLQVIMSEKHILQGSYWATAHLQQPMKLQITHCTTTLPSLHYSKGKALKILTNENLLKWLYNRRTKTQENKPEILNIPDLVYFGIFWYGSGSSDPYLSD